MSRLMTINKIFTTQINNQAQMTLQVTSTKKKEKRRRRKETDDPKLMQIIPEKETKGTNSSF